MSDTSAEERLVRALRFVADHEGHALFAHPDQPAIGCDTCATALGPRDLRWAFSRLVDRAGSHVPGTYDPAEHAAMIHAWDDLEADRP